MKKYKVHFSGYFGTHVEVDAESKDDAINKASEIFDEMDPSLYKFELEDIEAFEEKEI